MKKMKQIIKEIYGVIWRVVFVLSLMLLTEILWLIWG